ncbi:MAG TPA: hypothetical protein VFN44_02910 [Solirubrobacteraceae bacterium]|nr:hypothetical protein [Solirubrobacteraceae bacterium]
MAVTRPGLGPTLPGWLRERYGVPPWVTLAVAGVIAAAAVAAILVALTKPPSPGEQFVHEKPPVFNVLYPPEKLHQARPRAGELLRLEGRRAGLEVAVVVRSLDLPRFDGDVTHGLLPVYADRYVDAAKARMPGVELIQEGRARVNNGVGYEIGYQRNTASERFLGRDVLLVPDEPEVGRGQVLLSLRQRKSSGEKLTPPERNLAYLARKAYRSFRFGTERG